MVNYRLPFPPTINTMWRRAGSTIYLTKKGKDFRKEVLSIIDDPPFITGSVGVSITLIPPNRRKWDLDNRVKPVLDALEAAGVFEDDSQVDELIVDRRPPDGDGCADVIVYARAAGKRLATERPQGAGKTDIDS